jgi:hypothetical protein
LVSEIVHADRPLLHFQLQSVAGVQTPALPLSAPSIHRAKTGATEELEASSSSICAPTVQVVGHEEGWVWAMREGWVWSMRRGG